MNEKYKAIIWDVFWLCPVLILSINFLFSDYIFYNIGLNCFHPYFDFFTLFILLMALIIVSVLLYTLGFFFVKISQAIYYLLKKKYKKSLRSTVNVLIALLVVIVWRCSGSNHSAMTSFARGLKDHVETIPLDKDEINTWLDSVNWQDLDILRAPSKPFPKCLDSITTDWMCFFETETNKRYVKLCYGPKRWRFGLVLGAKSNEIPNPIDNEHRIDLSIDGHVWIDLEKDRHMEQP